MNIEFKEITINGIVYIPKHYTDIEKKAKDTNVPTIGDKVRFSGLNWYIIDDNYTLFLEDSFTDEQIKEYFDRYDDDYDVQFNETHLKIWWSESYIKEQLKKFVNDLDTTKLSAMTTELTINNETQTTSNLVRLITKEEVKKLQKNNLNVLATKRDYGYWTLSPTYWNGSAYVFRVGGSSNTGRLINYSVNLTYGVRPVIQLKSDISLTWNEKEDIFEVENI